MSLREEQNEGVNSNEKDTLSPVIRTQIPSGIHYIEINDISEDLETSVKKSRVITLIIIALCMILGSYLVVKNRLYDLSFKFERDGRMTIKRNLNQMDLLLTSKSNTVKNMNQPIMRVNPKRDADLVKILEKRILTLEKRLSFFETRQPKEDQNNKYSFFPLLAKNGRKPGSLHESKNGRENFLSRLRVARERKNEHLHGIGSSKDQVSYFTTYGALLGLPSIFDGVYNFLFGGGKIQIKTTGGENSSFNYKRNENTLEFRIHEKWREKLKMHKGKKLEHFNEEEEEVKSKKVTEKNSVKSKKKVGKKTFELKTRLDKGSTELQKNVEKGEIELKKKKAKAKTKLKKENEKKITEMRREKAKKEAELKRIKEKEKIDITKRKQKEKALLERNIEKETMKLKSKTDEKPRELKKKIEKEKAAPMKKNNDWKEQINAAALRRQLDGNSSNLKVQKERKEKLNRKKKRKDIVTSTNTITKSNTLKTKNSFKVNSMRKLRSDEGANDEEYKAKWYHFSPILSKTSQKQFRTMSPETIIRLKRSDFMEKSRKYGFFSAIRLRLRSKQKREESQDSRATASKKNTSSIKSSTIPEYSPMESKKRSKMLLGEMQLRRRKQLFKSITPPTKTNEKVILIQNSQQMPHMSENSIDTIRSRRHANRETVQESKLDAATHSTTSMFNIFNFRERSNASIHGAPLKGNWFNRVRFRQRTKKKTIQESRQVFKGVASKDSAHFILFSLFNIMSGIWNSSFGRIFNSIGNLGMGASRQIIHNSRIKQDETLKQSVVKEESVRNRLFWGNGLVESFASLSTNTKGKRKKNPPSYLGIRIRQMKQQA